MRIASQTSGAILVRHAKLLRRERVDDWTDALDELDVHAHRDDRGHDVGEDHGRVDAVAANGLQRDLGESSVRRPSSKKSCRSRSARYSGSERPA